MNATTLNTHSFWAYIQLMRPANIITAWADVLAGFATTGFIILTTEEVFQGIELAQLVPLVWLLLATSGLYGGGIVFNDVFDAEIDATERPERPIPSGRASRMGAAFLGASLLIVGILAAFQVTWLSAILACGVAAAALLYDAYSKHHAIFGPLNMGLCRGGNLLLGVSAASSMVSEYWALALIPIVYIAAITTMSRGEVHGGKGSNNSLIALLLIITVIAGMLGLGLLKNYQIISALPFVVLLAARVLLPFIKAVSEPSPDNIRKAVRAGVLSLIVLDATISAGFGSMTYGLLVLLLLPISMALSQIFAVT
ncbi:MAG: UbiA-like protein EboC [Scytonema sp. PMC 1069.18]|nr:UbiA-like protein EboC [Scytonema sp. PMC 1069.18]MEC4887933.1 UbiA-like protein EboC [Scytonema sp. PMC 1070.18]